MSLIQIGEVVDCLNTQPITFLIPGGPGGYDTSGNFIPGGARTTLVAEADVQPVSRTLTQVPEGQRVADLVEVFIADPTFIDTVNETTTTQEYQMVYRGTVWKVLDIPEDWRDNGYIDAIFVNTKQVYVP